MLLGSVVVKNISWGSFERFQECSASAAENYQLFPPNDWQIRVRADLLWKAVYSARGDENGYSEYDKSQVSHRRFRVLCGIYGLLGDKPFSCLTRSRIVAAAHGYNSPKRFKKDHPALYSKLNSEAGLKSISEDCHYLQENGFFAMLSLPRKNFFSNRLSPEELYAELKASKSKPSKQEERRAEARRLSQELRKQSAD